jgi:hypothetical protein
MLGHSFCESRTPICRAVRVLGRLLRADRWVFGGQEWKKLCDQRRDPRAFTAAINYGPSLKALRWVEPHPRHPRVLLAAESAAPALDAFEAIITDRLEHPAFSQFGGNDRGG